MPELSEEDRATLKKVADKQAEKAMAEHREEVEQNPREQLLRRVDRAEQALKEKGLTADVEILEKFKARFLKTLADNKAVIKKWDEEHHDNFLKRLAAGELRGLARRQIRHDVSIFSEIGEGGGWTSQGLWFTKDWLEKNSDQVKKDQERGIEYINYSLSPEAETIFYRALGALREDEDARDLRRIWEAEKDKPHEARRLVGGFSMGRDEMNLSLTTDLPGVEQVTIHKEPNFNAGRKGEWSTVVFSDKFLVEALKEE